LAVRNLRQAILRNSLTTLGIAGGVASLVAMLSLGVGLQALASQRLTRSGCSMQFCHIAARLRRSRWRSGRRTWRKSRPRSVWSSGKEARLLDEDARRELAQIPNVTEVYPQIRFAAQVELAGATGGPAIVPRRIQRRLQRRSCERAGEQAADAATNALRAHPRWDCRNLPARAARLRE